MDDCSEEASFNNLVGRILATIHLFAGYTLKSTSKAPQEWHSGRTGVGEEGGLALPLPQMASNLLVCKESLLGSQLYLAVPVQQHLVRTEHIPASISTITALSSGKRFSSALGSLTGMLKPLRKSQSVLHIEDYYLEIPKAYFPQHFRLMRCT